MTTAFLEKYTTLLRLRNTSACALCVSNEDNDLTKASKQHSFRLGSLFLHLVTFACLIGHTDKWDMHVLKYFSSHHKGKSVFPAKHCSAGLGELSEKQRYAAQ